MHAMAQTINGTTEIPPAYAFIERPTIEWTAPPEKGIAPEGNDYEQMDMFK